jgi:hypothetical protein
MKITRRLSDGLVQYKTTEPHELTDKHYKSDVVRAIDINNITHEVIEDIILPLDFRAGIHTYNNGVWGILNQEYYDEILASELVEAKSKAVLKFESDTDVFIKSIVGERAGEYELAEKEAISFKESGYIGDVPSSVSSDAIANGHSNQIACDNILEMATNWRTMQSQLRENRLLSKANVKKSKTVSEIGVIQIDWRRFLSSLKG